MMQKKVQIISDGSLDLSQELTKEKDIEVVPFYVSFDSETVSEGNGRSRCQGILSGNGGSPDRFPKDIQPSVHDYYEVFEKQRRRRCRSSVSVSPENSVAPCSLRQLQKI